MPFFSIILPVYNAAEWLEECLYSIIHQREGDFEVVIVNDGSTDESEKLIQSIRESHPELSWKVVNQENSGLGAARNAGIEAAKGEYLAFVDADDYWSLNKLGFFRRYLESSPADWLYHQVFELYPDGYLHRRRGFPVSNLDELLTRGNPISPSATIIKRSLLVEFNGFDTDRNGHGVEDLDLWIRLFHAGMKPVFLPSYFTVYRIGSGMTSSLSTHYEHIRFVMERAFRNGMVSASQLEQFNQRKQYEKARQLHKNGEFKEAVSAYATKKELKVRILKAAARLGIRI